jgi:hypothetical protein
MLNEIAQLARVLQHFGQVLVASAFQFGRLG